MIDGDLLPSSTASPGVLALTGAADITTAKRLLASAREHAAAGGDLIVDCAALERLDGAGVQILLALKREVEKAGRSFRMEAVPERAFGLLLLSGMGQALVSQESPVAPASTEAVLAPAASDEANGPLPLEAPVVEALASPDLDGSWEATEAPDHESVTSDAPEPGDDAEPRRPE